MDQFFHSIANQNGGNNHNQNPNEMNTPNNNMSAAPRSTSVGSLSSSMLPNGNVMNTNMNLLAGMLQNQQRGMGQPQGMNMSMFSNQMAFLQQQQQQHMHRRQSDASALSQNSAHNNAKTLLDMLSDGDALPQNNSAPQAAEGSNFDGGAQQQQQTQTQLLMAMQQRMGQRPSMQPQQQMMPPHNPMQQQQNPMQSNYQQQQQQQRPSSLQSMQALAQMQQNLAALQNCSPTPQTIEQHQSQIYDFLSRHGHNLSDDQRLNLRQQVGNPQLNAIMGAMTNNTVQSSDSTMVQMLEGMPHMNDLMSRQREQLRSLQVILKTEDDPNGPQQGQMVQQQHQQQQQRGQMQDLNSQMAAQMMNNVRMQGQQQQNNSMSQGQQQQQQQQQHQDFFRTNAGGGMGQNQQPVAVRSQQQSNMQQGGQQNQSQQRLNSALMEQMIRQRQNPESQLSQHPLKRHLSPESQPPSQNKVKRNNLLHHHPSPPITSSEQIQPSTRVVPVALSPHHKHPISSTGDISEATLIYTKHALNSIVCSLNSKSLKEEEGKRTYTIRDLSTCLGAWDLSHPSVKKKELTNDGNADTAFQFYYERSCPILFMDGKRDFNRQLYSVEDFGEGGERVKEENLPALAGAVVLTFGADEKFTGGIGEEGVLTKAIIEFFYEPAVALGKSGDGGGNVDMDALVEAEEQMFARMDNEQSSFIKAALHALSPSDGDTVGDKKVYVPTIWSGNTHRVYQYCLLGNFDDEGKELASKRLCVAIQKKPSSCDDGPAKGVCRITCTLSPASVMEEKKRMANKREGETLNEFSSTIHRKIRQNLRCLRPPKLVSPSSLEDRAMGMGPGRRRVNLRRPSMTHSIDPSLIVVGMRCKHELLLDAEEIGKVYINGSLIVDCSLPDSSSIGKTSAKANILSTLGLLSPDILPAHTLFGIDFTFPTRSEAMFFRDVPGKAVLEQEYGALLIDALIDATQFESDVAGKLLCRLVTGKIENVDDDDDDEQDDKDKKDHSRSSSKSSTFYEDDIDDHINSIPSSEISFDDVSKHCIESIVLSSAAADPVGIGAKALSTKFRMQYGKEYYPCETGTDEEHRLCKILGPKKLPKSVPRRVRDILCRGGYLPLNKMAAFIWTGSGASWDGDHNDSMLASEAMEDAIQLLSQAGCNDVKPNMIRFVGRKQLEVADASVSCLRCWYDAQSATYFVNDSILFAEEKVESSSATKALDSNSSTTEPSQCEGDKTDDSKKDANPKADEPNVTTNEKHKSDEIIEEKSQDAIKAGEESGVAKHDAHLPKDEENKNSVDVLKVASDVEEKKDEVIAGEETAKISSDQSNVAQNQDLTSLAYSEQTDKAANPGNQDSSKPCYKPSKEVAYLLALSIANEHPDVMLLERFVICHTL